MTRDFTLPYSALESWAYDRLIAPAVTEMADALEPLLASAPRPIADILDVGCGGGQNAILVGARRPDARITGLDLSREQIARAEHRARKLGDRLQFVVGSALEMPFSDASFDAVYSIASIKHWPDPARGLAECARVLRPGGVLVVVEADRGCRLSDARRFVERWRLPRPLALATLPLFRTFVAGQALDLDDARRLLEALPLEGREARRIEGTPGLLMTGRRQ